MKFPCIMKVFGMKFPCIMKGTAINNRDIILLATGFYGRNGYKGIPLFGDNYHKTLEGHWSSNFKVIFDIDGEVK